MRQLTDRELLDSYVRRDDHEAFAELVQRHMAFVLAAARRQTLGDASLADDVAQAVMIVLARRAASIAPGVALPSWLVTVTRHAAQNAMKIRTRQRFHERRALATEARVERSVASPDDANADLRDVLDDAIARLPEPDRSGVVLHYLNERSHAEVGAALGLSSEAARKRIERALEKMRLFLTGRGVVTTGAAIVAAMHAEAASAASIVVPAQLVTSTVNLIVLSGAGAAQTSAASSAALAIAKGVSHMLTLAKLKAAAAIALVVTAVAGATVTPILQHGAPHLLPQTVTSMMVTDASAQAEPQKPAVVEVTPEIKLEFLGLSSFPGDENSWFSIAGEPIPMPDEAMQDSGIRMPMESDYQMAIRVRAPKGVEVMPQIEGAGMAAHSHNRSGDDSYVVLSRFSMTGPSESFSMHIGIASSDWKTIATTDKPTEQVEADAGEHGMMTFEPADQDPMMSGTRVSVAHQPTKLPSRAIAIDEAGREHEAQNVNVRQTNDDCTTSYTFDLPAERIKNVQVQVRKFDKFVDVKDISLSQGHKTSPKITVTEAKKKD
jgi:RNA polymerase sigma factor (sigma-70 family)